VKHGSAARRTVNDVDAMGLAVVDIDSFINLLIAP
jgi:hypothetical protein